MFPDRKVEFFHLPNLKLMVGMSPDDLHGNFAQNELPFSDLNRTDALFAIFLGNGAVNGRTEGNLVGSN